MLVQWRYSCTYIWIDSPFTALLACSGTKARQTDHYWSPIWLICLASSIQPLIHHKTNPHGTIIPAHQSEGELALPHPYISNQSSLLISLPQCDLLASEDLVIMYPYSWYENTKTLIPVTQLGFLVTRMKQCCNTLIAHTHYLEGGLLYSFQSSLTWARLTVLPLFSHNVPLVLSKYGQVVKI